MNKPKSSFPRRGEIYQIYFHPKRGKEIGKIRPSLVISNDEQMSMIAILLWLR